MSKNKNKLSYRDKYLKILQKFPNIEKLDSHDMNKTSTSFLKDLVFIAIENWKIEKKLNKIKQNNWEDITAWIEYPMKRIYEILEKNNIKIVDYTWKKYIEWMNGIDIISVEKDASRNDSIILDSITPMIEVNWVISERSKVIILSK